MSFCRMADRLGLVRCSSGNMSVRLDEESFAVTATQSWMGDMSPEEVAICSISDGSQLGQAKPSVESKFHAGILRQRKDIDVVLHFQSQAATALACSNIQPDFNVILEIPYYIGLVAKLPFLSPGSGELASSVIDAMKNHDMLLLENHGQVTVGKDFRDAIQRAVFFEFACQVILQAGNSVNTLSDEHVKLLREKALGGEKGV